MFKYVVISKKSPIQFSESELRAVLEHHAKVVGDSYVSMIVNSGHSLCPVRSRNPFVE